MNLIWRKKIMNEIADLYLDFAVKQEELEEKVDELLKNNPEFKLFRINAKEDGYFEIYSSFFYPQSKSHLGYVDRIGLAKLIYEEKREEELDKVSL